MLIVTLLQVILVAATIASVADFCLQVTMHPRLNRAFVNIFFNYMTQFTASLMDEEVLTRSSYSKSGPFTVLGRCILASMLMSFGALSLSLLIDGKGGVDMKLMNNAMFTLQTEHFFERPTTIHHEEINCTAASSALQSTLGVSEQYELDGLGNDDHCALLWRKTTGFEGDQLFELDLNVTVPDVTSNATAEDSAASDGEKKVKMQPNIIVINMESWRHLDVGVLGGAAKKEAVGKSATPHFDELAKTGVLYSKHYTQCVQTTRTLLTTLFGMLPSCTETTALKQYSTTLNVRGLPQFLKNRGYFNVFWSAVDLTWEYWDKFLLQNGFDKLVDDRKIRKMLHETRNYKNTPDDHFSWGMHDHLSFEMLLYAIESAHSSSMNSTNTSSSTSTHSLAETNAVNMSTNTTDEDAITVPEAAAKGRHYHAAHSAASEVSTASKSSTKTAISTTKPPLPGWEGLQSPYFIDMYSITSHNPWALPDFYDTPDLSGLYTRYNKKYLDSMYFSDEMLGDFIAALRAKGLMKNTIVIIEGDHGYGRLEHDNNPSIADSGVWDEASRVPFLLLADDFLRDKDRGTVVNQLSMQSDLMATIADILGVTLEEPLYQHGYGHSMKRRREQPQAQAEAMAAQTLSNEDVELQDSEAEVLAVEAREGPQERRVVMCNPFNGMSKGVRTEELKYIFHPDGSYNVFEPAIDPAEKRPLRTGFDIEEMDDATRDVFEYVTKAVDLNQFLFEANRFMTPLPAAPTKDAEEQSRYDRLRRSHPRNETVSEQVEPQAPRGPPAPEAL
ncbi:hypothetical protein BBJ29_008410 [Phytophthora kernoviae]|uniref:Sulfatase N-terminal domain-containing protein n=1 Tax=Phytophthora kernoviae TaxID=325452 RepID=A0A3F2RKQ0_9STRA|nr:hypothetical protein BBP00_00006561 [Phytophthora kernoviae]RLN70567.1 hypothetical protein BBJ29_008410 [Phytophthora kernoviae]